MTITAVNFWANTQGGVDAEGTHSYTNVYEVLTDDKDDCADTVRGPEAVAMGLPDYNEPWAAGDDSNPHALAKTRHAELRDVSETRRLWRVTIGYTTKGQTRNPSSGGGGSGNREGVQDPINEQWKVRGSYASTQKTTSLDEDGARIANSAEEEKLVSIPSGHDTLVISGNTSTIDLLVRAAAVLKCNSTDMWGLAARQVFLAQWAWEILHRGNTEYVAHRLEFWIADPLELWDFEYLDYGTRTIIDASSRDPEFRYKRASAQDMALGGIHLDGAGGKLDMVANPDGFTITVQVIKAYDFLTNMTFLPDPIPGPFV